MTHQDHFEDELNFTEISLNFENNQEEVVLLGEFEIEEENTLESDPNENILEFDPSENILEPVSSDSTELLKKSSKKEMSYFRVLNFIVTLFMLYYNGLDYFFEPTNVVSITSDKSYSGLIELIVPDRNSENQFSFWTNFRHNDSDFDSNYISRLCAASKEFTQNQSISNPVLEFKFILSPSMATESRNFSAFSEKYLTSILNDSSIKPQVFISIFIKEFNLNFDKVAPVNILILYANEINSADNFELVKKSFEPSSNVDQNLFGIPPLHLKYFDIDNSLRKN